MLRRMYLKWFDKKKFNYEVLRTRVKGGIKSSTIKVNGEYLYGLMRGESGVHRLVTFSFDSGARRHTSFASVWVLPAVDEISINIDEKDLRIDTFRSSGAGGQHVNTTDSAVRITICHQKLLCNVKTKGLSRNKRNCYKMLNARLYEYELQKEAANQKELGIKKDIGWGHQIRSYILQPYQLVKDLRNKVENTNSSRFWMEI